jgi:hypothetical protein
LIEDHRSIEEIEVPYSGNDVQIECFCVDRDEPFQGVHLGVDVLGLEVVVELGEVVAEELVEEAES